MSVCDFSYKACISPEKAFYGVRLWTSYYLQPGLLGITLGDHK